MREAWHSQMSCATLADPPGPGVRRIRGDFDRHTCYGTRLWYVIPKAQQYRRFHNLWRPHQVRRPPVLSEWGSALDAEETVKWRAVTRCDPEVLH